MFDSWLTLSGFGMDLKQVSRSLDPDAPATAGAWRRPTKFASYRDDQGGFELGYPSGWDLTADGGVLVRSRSLSSYAKVDVLPSPDAKWIAFLDLVLKAGGTLRLLKEVAGPPRQFRGLLELGSARFDLRAWAYPRGAQTIVLSCGVESAASPPLKRYAERIMTAIRREFRIKSADSSLPVR